MDIIYSEDRSSHILAFDSGCFANGEVGYYEKAKPDTLYKFDYVPVEIRSRYDPYTVWARSNYNLGRQTKSFTYPLLFLSIIFGLMTGYFYYKNQKEVDAETKPILKN